MRSAIVLGLMTAVLFPLPAQGCGTSTAPEAVVQTQVDAYNAHDLERFVQCYADDITIHDLSGKDPPVKGLAALRKDYQWLTKAPQEYRVQIVKRVVVGRIVVDVERVLGLPKEKERPKPWRSSKSVTGRSGTYGSRRRTRRANNVLDAQFCNFSHFPLSGQWYASFGSSRSAA